MRVRPILAALALGAALLASAPGGGPPLPNPSPDAGAADDAAVIRELELLENLDLLERLHLLDAAGE